VPKPSLPAGAAQDADAGKTVVIEQHNVDLDALLQRLTIPGANHQVRAVSDQHVNFTSGSAILYASPPQSRSPCMSIHTPCD